AYGLIIKRTERQEAFENKLQNFIASDFGLKSAAYEAASGSRESYSYTILGGVAQQSLFCSAALTKNRCSLIDCLFRYKDYSLLCFFSKGMIYVIAAQQKMLTDGGPFKADIVSARFYSYQTQIGCSASHVANKYKIAVFNEIVEMSVVCDNPRIENRKRLFKQS